MYHIRITRVLKKGRLLQIFLYQSVQHIICTISMTVRKDNNDKKTEIIDSIQSFPLFLVMPCGPLAKTIRSFFFL